MKKIIIISVLILGGIFTHAQTNFDAGVNIGFPIGDAGKFYNFNLGINAEYVFPVNEKFKIGPAIAYDLWLVKDSNLGSQSSFLPVSAALKIYPTEKLLIGGDIGYAIGLGKGNTGGFYYVPKLGYASQFFDIYGFYKGISNKGSIGAVGAGFMYKF